VALTAGKLAADPSAGAMTRTTAIQVCVQLGVTDAQIRAITVDNPRRFFGRA